MKKRNVHNKNISLGEITHKKIKYQSFPEYVYELLKDDDDNNVVSSIILSNASMTKLSIML